MISEKKLFDPVYYQKDLAKMFKISTRTLQARLNELLVKNPTKSCLTRSMGKKQYFFYSDVEEIIQMTTAQK
jgi:hypothetical protein|tara:strand:+ start:487 stop:702 length:216 start_codon:yes stop_codon:yes gene_type:complete